MSYGPHETLVAPARRSAQPWRLVLGIVVITLTLLAVQRVLQAVLMSALTPEELNRFAGELREGATPTAVLLLLGGLGALGLGAVLAVRWLHRRPAVTLIGPPGLALWQFLRVLGAIVALYLAIAVLPPHGGLPELQPGLPSATWLAFLPATVVAVLVQTGSEELVFRGYMQQQLAAWRNVPLLWIGLPSALFAWGHYSPDMFEENAWIVVLWAFVFGVAMADLTARSGTLGPAIAVHFANNFVAVALFAMPGELSGLSLYLQPVDAESTPEMRLMLVQDLVVLGLTWLAARIALRR